MELVNLENVAISCVTAKEAIACCSLASDLGWTWCSGKPYIEKNCWDIYEKTTCYSFANGEYCDLGFYKDMGYTVKSSEWFLDNFSIKENSSKLEDLYSMADSSTKKLLESRFSKEELGIKEELPNTWEEFCSKNNIKDGEVYINRFSDISGMKENTIRDFNMVTRKPKFEPFDKVLVRYGNSIWYCDFFCYIKDGYFNTSSRRNCKHCIPYNEETKHLIGTSDDCPKYDIPL